jgi:hypothetical protein
MFLQIADIESTLFFHFTITGGCRRYTHSTLLAARCNTRACSIDHILHNLFPIGHRRRQKFNRLFQFQPRLLLLLFDRILLTHVKETLRALLLYGGDRLDRLNGGRRDIAVVLDGSVPSLFKIKSGVVLHFFSTNFSVCLGPSHFSWVLLLVKAANAFRSTKTKLFGIVPNKDHSVPGIARTRTKVTRFDTHLVGGLTCSLYDKSLFFKKCSCFLGWSLSGRGQLQSFLLAIGWLRHGLNVFLALK